MLSAITQSLFRSPSQLNVLAAEIFGELQILNRNKSSIPVLFNGPEVLTSPTDKVNLFANLFADRFAANSTLDDLGRDLPDCPSRVDSSIHDQRHT